MDRVKKSVWGEDDSLRFYGYIVKKNNENKFDKRVYLDTGHGYVHFEVGKCKWYITILFDKESIFLYGLLK